MTYKPGPVPTGDLPATQRWLRTELARISSAIDQVEAIQEAADVTRQMCYINGTNLDIEWSTESGWAVLNPNPGIYYVSFPTVAPTDMQQVVIVQSRDPATTESYASIRSLAANEVTVKMRTYIGNIENRDFMVLRYV